MERAGQGLLFVPPGLPQRQAGRNGVGEPAWVEASLEAMERLMGLILTTMAVQMLISGLKVAFATA